jgi:predicted phosphodiesterase
VKSLHHPPDKARLDEIQKSVNEKGVDITAKVFKLSRETVKRYIRDSKETIEEKVDKPDALLRKIRERFNDDELRQLANAWAFNPKGLPKPILTFEGDEVVVGFCTDTHIGEVSFNDSLWISFIEECKRENVSLIVHAGDVHEGMSNRPDQIYHLEDIGSSAQMDHAERLFKMTDIPIKVIDGNHDRWGIKSNGLFMVRDLANRMPGNVEFLGSDSGYFYINGTRWMLWHGEDGSSYATSYRVQKLIEAFTGGDKPQVLLVGHTHKEISMFERNVHTVSGGALSYQSAWMKSKRMPCHTGFHIIRATIRDNQIVKFSTTFYPFYE